MATSYREYLPNQGQLLPSDMREWLCEGHLALHVSDLVDQLDLSSFHARYEAEDGRGNRAHDPRMMLKVLVYAYASGVFSSRKIAAKLEEDVAFRVLGAGNFPAHRTVCDFRRRHLEDFKKAFVEVALLARGLGFARFGKLSVDGTKVRANASRRRSLKLGSLEREEARLASEIDGLVAKAGRIDEAEDAELGPDVRGDETPEGLRDRGKRRREIERVKARLDAVRGARENLESERAEDERLARERALKPGPRARGPRGGSDPRGNLTDADSRVMRTVNEGYQQCYNAQLAVDAEHQLVVAAEVTRKASDHGGLPRLLDAVESGYGECPETLLADGGYCNERDLRDLEERGVTGYVAPGRQKSEQALRNPGSCPAITRMAERFGTAEAAEVYRDRKWLSEAPNAWIKRVMGFRQFSVRGLARVSGEWDLVCLALNVRRMEPRMAAAAAPG